jgi:hypothetical protein
MTKGNTWKIVRGITMLELTYELITSESTCETFKETFYTPNEVLDYLADVGCHMLTWKLTESSTGKEVEI